MALLGFPDATIVTGSFGVYVADNVQKIQLCLIANCRDESSTRHGLQKLFDWLVQTGEDALLAKRAARVQDRRRDSEGSCAMIFCIADSFPNALRRLSAQEQKAVKDDCFRFADGPRRAGASIPPHRQVEGRKFLVDARQPRHSADRP